MPTRRHRTLAIVALGVMVLLMLSFVLTRFDTDPSGQFRVDEMGTSKLSYFEFKDGRVLLVVEGYSTDECGYYTNNASTWVWVETGGDTNLLRATPFGLHLKSIDGSWSKYLPRM